MNEKRIKEVIRKRGVAPKKHLVPDEDSVFYRRFKSEISLNNSTTTYCKVKRYLFSKEGSFSENKRPLVKKKILRKDKIL